MTKNNNNTLIARYDPPKNLSPLEAQYIISQNLSSKGLHAQLAYLVEEGLVSTRRKNNNELSFRRLKKPDTKQNKLNPQTHLFIKKIFGSGREVIIRKDRVEPVIKKLRNITKTVLRRRGLLLRSTSKKRHLTSLILAPLALLTVWIISSLVFMSLLGNVSMENQNYFRDLTLGILFAGSGMISLVPIYFWITSLVKLIADISLAKLSPEGKRLRRDIFGYKLYLTTSIEKDVLPLEEEIKIVAEHTPYAILFDLKSVFDDKSPLF